jgi:hypothetical protein
VDAVTWTDRFATALGIDPPSETEVRILLSLASVAANASERVAAPVACWLAATAGRSPEEALALARAISSPDEV